MARFLNINATYNPLTMDEMLKVPLLYDAAYKEAEKNIDEYNDKLARYRALAGDDARASKLFNEYDSMLNSIANDYSIRNMQTVGRRLRNTYRDITAKFDKAESDYNIYREMKLKNPDLVGNIGNIMDYYNTNYTPYLINGKEFATSLGTDIAALAQQQPYRELGYIDAAKSKIMYGQGFTNDQLLLGYQDALSGNPKSELGVVILKHLNNIGYNNLPSETKAQLGSYIINGLQYGSMKTTAMPNANYISPVQGHSINMDNKRFELEEKKYNLALVDAGMKAPEQDDPRWNNGKIETSTGVWDYNNGKPKFKQFSYDEQLDRELKKEKIKQAIKQEINDEYISDETFINNGNDESPEWESVEALKDIKGYSHSKTEGDYIILRRDSDGKKFKIRKDRYNYLQRNKGKTGLEGAGDVVK